MIRNHLFLLIFFYSYTALSADNLGRLFLTPEQRAQLEIVRAQRDRRLPVTADTEVSLKATPVPQGPEVVTYNGVVRRSDGKSTVWISGKPINEPNSGKHDGVVNVLDLQGDGAVSVAVPQAARTASLKVGQRLEVTSGRVEESYTRRETMVHPGTKVTAEVASPETSVPQDRVNILPLPSSVTGTTTRLRDRNVKAADLERGAAPSTRASGK
jgi:hypothetical protein